MRKLIAGVALVGALVGPTLIADRTAQASPTHGFRYTATVVCYEPLTRRDARHIALIRYNWTVWGTLQLKYVCGTMVGRTSSLRYHYTARVWSRAPMAEDSAAHVRLVRYERHDGSIWNLTYRTLRKGY